MKSRRLHLRSEKLTNATAFSVAAAIMLVPANFLPIVSTQTSSCKRGEAPRHTRGA